MLKSEVFGRDRAALRQPNPSFKLIASSMQTIGDYQLTLGILELPFRANMAPGEQVRVGVRVLVAKSEQAHAPFVECIPLAELESPVLRGHFRQFLGYYPGARRPKDDAEYQKLLSIAFPQTFSPAQ